VRPLFYNSFLDDSPIALLSLTIGTFDTYSGLLQEDQQLNEVFVTFLGSFGTLGTMFGMPAGWLFDFFGPFWCCAAGSIIVPVSYLVFGLTSKQTWPLMLISLNLVSWGSGLFTVAATANAIVTTNGVGIGIIASAIGISVAFCVSLLTAYQNVTGCVEPYCWRQYIFFYSAVTFLFMMPLSLVFLLQKFRTSPVAKEITTEIENDESDGKDNDYEEEARGSKAFFGAPNTPTSAPQHEPTTSANTNERTLLLSPSPVGGSLDFTSTKELVDFHAQSPPIDDDELAEYKSLGIDPVLVVASYRRISLMRSFLIVRHRYFWALILSNFSMVSTGIIFLLNMRQMTVFLHLQIFGVEPSSGAVSVTFICFSLLNVLGGIVMGAFCDILRRRKLRSMYAISFFCLQAAAALSLTAIILYVAPRFAASPILLKNVLFVTGCFLFAWTGMVYGANWSGFPVAISELYGVVNYGKYMGVLQIAGALGTLVTPPLFSYCAIQFLTPLYGIVVLMVLLLASTIMVALKPDDWKPLDMPENDLEEEEEA
jgi:MFS family permease